MRTKLIELPLTYVGEVLERVPSASLIQNVNKALRTKKFHEFGHTGTAGDIHADMDVSGMVSLVC